TLHLASPPQLSAKSGKGGILTVSVEAGSRERARQIDAEAVVILTQKVQQRFGTTAGVSTTLLDPAHAAEQTSPTPGRNLLITGLIGLVAGFAAAGALSRGRDGEAGGGTGARTCSAAANAEGRRRRQMEPRRTRAPRGSAQAARARPGRGMGDLPLPASRARHRRRRFAAVVRRTGGGRIR